ncbi:Mo-dependent nitrogenase C-terminal domain-containing protein [Microcoleus sp. FACHB-68]|nr:Mo-dependent nitrogenase C-terminal domain-containing protein [Microcoleus sp. FACHB-68]MBD1940006.1 Mo-dependent nitrogenase C-terminal domain-containing protein [Microcoleus sp. FACHB-68]
MNVSHNTIRTITIASWVWIAKPETPMSAATTANYPSQKPGFDPLQPLRQWLDQVQVQNRELAHRLCQLIPAQCPFERDIKVFGRTLFHIPPMCKLNPLYEEVVGLRFRALCYLADKCGEDVTRYC